MHDKSVVALCDLDLWPFVPKIIPTPKCIQANLVTDWQLQFFSNCRAQRQTDGRSVSLYPRSMHIHKTWFGYKTYNSLTTKRYSWQTRTFSGKKKKSNWKWAQPSTWNASYRHMVRDNLQYLAKTYTWSPWADFLHFHHKWFQLAAWGESRQTSRQHSCRIKSALLGWN